MNSNDHIIAFLGNCDDEKKIVKDICASLSVKSTAVDINAVHELESLGSDLRKVLVFGKLADSFLSNGQLISGMDLNSLIWPRPYLFTHQTFSSDELEIAREKGCIDVINLKHNYKSKLEKILKSGFGDSNFGYLLQNIPRSKIKKVDIHLSIVGRNGEYGSIYFRMEKMVYASFGEAQGFDSLVLMAKHGVLLIQIHEVFLQPQRENMDERLSIVLPRILELGQKEGFSVGGVPGLLREFEGKPIFTPWGGAGNRDYGSSSVEEQSLKNQVNASDETLVLGNNGMKTMKSMSLETGVKKGAFSDGGVLTDSQGFVLEEEGTIDGDTVGATVQILVDHINVLSDLLGISNLKGVSISSRKKTLVYFPQPDGKRVIFYGDFKRNAAAALTKLDSN